METEGPPRRSRRRTTAVITACVVVAAGLIAVGLQHGPPMSPNGMVDLLGKITYPAGSEVCSGPMTPHCANQAAVRAGYPIAWLASAPGFTTDGIHLMTIRTGNGTGLFIEELHSNSALADLQVGQTANDTGAPDGTAQVGGVLATISHRFDFGAAGGGTFDYYATWMVGSRRARLTVSSDKLWGGSPQTTRAILTNLLAAVQIAYPVP